MSPPPAGEGANRAEGDGGRGGCPQHGRSEAHGDGARGAQGGEFGVGDAAFRADDDEQVACGGQGVGGGGWVHRRSTDNAAESRCTARTAQRARPPWPSDSISDSPVRSRRTVAACLPSGPSRTVSSPAGRCSTRNTGRVVTGR